MTKGERIVTLCKGSHGFSLLELMMALGILAVGILAIVSMQIATIQENDTAVELTEANLSAQTIIESFMPVNYTSLPNAGTSYTVISATSLNNIVSGGFATLPSSISSKFTVEFRVVSETDTDGDGTNDLKEINVRVRDSSNTVRSSFTFVKGR